MIDNHYVLCSALWMASPDMERSKVTHISLVGHHFLGCTILLQKRIFERAQMKLVIFVSLVAVSIVGLTKAGTPSNWPPVLSPFPSFPVSLPYAMPVKDVDRRALLRVLLSSVMKSSMQAASEQDNDDVMMFLRLLQQRNLKQKKEEAKEERCVCITSPCYCSQWPF